MFTNVLTEEDHKNLFLDLELGSATLQELGDKYRVSRERIRQLEAKWLDIAGRKHRHSTKTKIEMRMSRIKDENFQEAYNYVWREAVKQGFVVKAWASWRGHIYNRALFINGRRVWVCRASTKSNVTPKMKYSYYRFNGGEQGTRIVVADEEPNLRFYILLNFAGENRRLFYIPTERSTYHTSKNQFHDCLNAWHLLASNNGTVSHAPTSTSEKAIP